MRYYHHTITTAAAAAAAAAEIIVHLISNVATGWCYINCQQTKTRWSALWSRVNIIIDLAHWLLGDWSAESRWTVTDKYARQVRVQVSAQLARCAGRLPRMTASYMQASKHAMGDERGMEWGPGPEAGAQVKDDVSRGNIWWCSDNYSGTCRTN